MIKIMIPHHSKISESLGELSIIPDHKRSLTGPVMEKSFLKIYLPLIIHKLH